MNLGEYYLAKMAGYVFPQLTSLRYIPEKSVTSDVATQKRIADDPLWYKGALKLQMGTVFVEAVKVSAQCVMSKYVAYGCPFSRLLLWPNWPR